MKKDFKIANRFREQLKQELQIWQADGIISPDQSAAITQRYKLDKTGRESRNILLFAIYIIGAVLIAAGVISFVAAHWDKIASSVKIILIISFMLACHLSVFYFWKIPGKSPRLGHALITLGTLVFGANIGLLAQIFHIKANFYNGLYAWAVGAVVMAYALKSIPNVIIAIVVSFIAFWGWVDDYPSAFCYYPFIAAVVFLPFAYLHRSILTFIFSLLAIGISVIVCACWGTEEFSAFILATGGVALLFFSLGLLAYRTTSFKSFASPAMVLAVSFAAMNAYMPSFRALAKEVEFGYSTEGNMWVIPVASVYIIAVLIWAYVFKSILSTRRLRPISISIFAATILVLSGIITKTCWTYDDHLLLVISSNLACLALCIGLIVNSFLAEDRRLFWAGILFTALIITSRFLEYETDLLLKAIVFTACGVGLILAGVKFENFLKKRKLINE